MKFEFLKRHGTHEGLQWRFKTDDEKHSLSILCFNLSAGGAEGFFETMSSWDGDVSGDLTFKEVQEKIDEIYRIEEAGE